MVTTQEIATICPTCGQTIYSIDETCACPECNCSQHHACWEQRGGCATTGCAHATTSLADLLGQGAPPKATGKATNPLLPWIIGIGVFCALILAAVVALILGVSSNLVLIIAVIAAALTFDYVNGMHDAGNAIATVISTRVLTPHAALFMAAALNLFGAMIHSGVATMIAYKFADMKHIHPDHPITLMMILCGLVGASAWSYLTASWGLPVSTSHSLFGGLIGVFLLGRVPLNMNFLGVFALWMVFAPLLAFSVGWLLMNIINMIVHGMAPHKINRYFRGLQMLSSASMAFSHGSNDAQKAMGIITMALVFGNFLPQGSDVPLWVKVSCALVIALGTAFGGMRVIRTLGDKIIKLAPVHGFAAESVAAGTIQLVTFLHIPISTTHVISSSILGIGASKRLSAVRWGVAGNIISAWLFTIPTCAMAGALLYWVVTLFGGR